MRSTKRRAWAVAVVGLAAAVACRRENVTPSAKSDDDGAATRFDSIAARLPSAASLCTAGGPGFVRDERGAISGGPQWLRTAATADGALELRTHGVALRAFVRGASPIPGRLAGGRVLYPNAIAS